MSHLSWQIALLILLAIPIGVAFVAIIVDAMLYSKRKHRIAQLRRHNPYSVGRDAHRDVRGIHR
jgi:hypothetical protein